MIKFNCLIHKATGHMINYEEWLEKVKKYEEIIFFIEDDGEYIYNSKTILYEDHFEIIYDSEFTLEELGIIFRSNQKFNEELMKKVYKSMNDKECLKAKYKIEV